MVDGKWFEILDVAEDASFYEILGITEKDTVKNINDVEGRLLEEHADSQSDELIEKIKESVVEALKTKLSSYKRQPAWATVLGLDKSASEDEIVAAYDALCEKLNLDSTEDEVLVKRINVAF